MIPESQVLSSIADYMVKSGYEVIRFNSGGGKAASGMWVWYYHWLGKIGQKSHSGVPDLYVFGKGLAFWIEVKRKNGAKRAKQREFIEAVKASGGQGSFIDSLDEAIKFEAELQRLRRTHNEDVGEVRQERLAECSPEGQPDSSGGGSKRKRAATQRRAIGTTPYMQPD